MEATTEFRKKWRELRDEIKVPDKDKDNPHFRSSYRSWEATEKALSDAGIKSHFVTINTDTQAGVEWWVEIEEEEVKVNTCLVDKAKRDPQATGGCFSYALRYCVATYLGWGIPDVDDDGNDATGIEVDTSFDPVVLEAELAAEKSHSVNQAPVAADKSTEKENITAASLATLLIDTINMQGSTQALLEYWNNNHAEFDGLMALDKTQYERAIQAYQKRGHFLKTEESKKDATDK
tara:strand:- start:3264 stop:3968 length:705 start_codon:yes stop_codon:yes gene_type:complete